MGENQFAGNVLQAVSNVPPHEHSRSEGNICDYYSLATTRTFIRYFKFRREQRTCIPAIVELGLQQRTYIYVHSARFARVSRIHGFGWGKRKLQVAPSKFHGYCVSCYFAFLVVLSGLRIIRRVLSIRMISSNAGPQTLQDLQQKLAKLTCQPFDLANRSNVSSQSGTPHQQVSPLDSFLLRHYRELLFNVLLVLTGDAPNPTCECTVWREHYDPVGGRN